MCATACGKRTYFMLSGWFSSSSGFFHTRLFWLYVCVSYACLGAGVCVYVYWSNFHVYAYILQVDTHEVVMCVDRCCMRSSHGFGHILIDIHTGFTCIYIYVYAHRVHMCGYIFTYMHPRFICVCVYITYIHAEFTCACEYDGEYTHRSYICM